MRNEQNNRNTNENYVQEDFRDCLFAGVSLPVVVPARRPKSTAESNTLPYRLHVGRLGERFTQEELASEIGTTRSALAKYESGRMALPWSVARAWARRLDCNLRWLATGKEPQRPYISPDEMKADVSAVERLAEVVPFADVYVRHIQKAAEKWHAKTSGVDLVMRQLEAGPRSVMRRLTWRQLRATIHSLSEMIPKIDGENVIFETVVALGAALDEMKRRLAEKHPHLATRI